MEDIALNAFSVFFSQSPSFRAHQKAMQKANGKSNAKAVFGIGKFPCANQTRDTLDGVPPDTVFSVFDTALSVFQRDHDLDSFRAFDQNLLIGLDGTWYFSSQKLSCDNCSVIKHANGNTTYYHSAITPVIVAPGRSQVIPLCPEFIVPQDGYHKQDCEIAAAKRWLQKHAAKYRSMMATLLGDDLYSRQPFCEQVRAAGFNFIFVCKPESHKTLYEYLDSPEGQARLNVVTLPRINGKRQETCTYRYANDVPLREGVDALRVNWFEVVISDDSGKVVYKNSFVTHHKITNTNVASAVRSGRARWKVENENNNTLKTKGYHLEHNFGHGEKHLSSLLCTLNLLAFLGHTLLGVADEKFRLIRETLPTRETFFSDLRALMRYLCFESWDQMMDFMFKRLELDVAPDT